MPLKNSFIHILKESQLEKTSKMVSNLHGISNFCKLLIKIQIKKFNQ